jgi:hypothetical protein
MKSARLLLAVLLFWLVGFVAAIALPGQAFAQSKDYHMDRYDSTITVNADGSMDIMETLTYVFSSGTFHRGLRTWDLARVDRITVNSVTETNSLKPGKGLTFAKGAFDPDNSTTGVVGTYGTENDGTQLRLRWIFGDTTDATRTFQIAYHVDGVTRVYSNYDELDWYAVPPGWGAAINASRVSVTFPVGTDTSSWDVASVPKDAEVSKQGNTITWSTGSIPSGGFEVGAKIPKGVLNATKPSWQDSFDQQNPQQSGNAGGVSGGTPLPIVSTAPEDPTRALIDFIIFGVSVVVLFGGILWRLIVWYTQGRDKPVKLPLDYLAGPPSDLPPGLVGTLLDESADVRDVIATIADLGRRGNLTITETQTNGLGDYIYTRIGNKTDYRYEEMVMQALFGDNQAANLSSFKSDFQNSLTPIYSEMYKNLVALKYFPQSPEDVRKKASRGCGWTSFLGLVAFFAGLFFGAQLSYMLIVFGMALGIVAIVRLFTSSAMPRKTDFGAEQAARWNAFKRYLQQIQRYTNVQAAADKFQQYLPYAVAMGINKDFTRQFNRVPAAMPAWYAPYGYQPLILNMLTPGYGPGPGSFSGAGVSSPAPAPNLDPGAAMQGMSNSLAGAMQGLSDSFTGMVNSASTVFTGGTIAGGVSGAGKAAGSAVSGDSTAANVAGSVGGFLVGAALSAIFGGGGSGGGGGGAD